MPKFYEPATGEPTDLLSRMATYRNHNGLSATDPLKYAATELARLSIALDRANARLKIVTLGVAPYKSMLDGKWHRLLEGPMDPLLSVLFNAGNNGFDTPEDLLDNAVKLVKDASLWPKEG